jgi:hypothetical protein
LLLATHKSDPISLSAHCCSLPQAIL